MNQKGVEINNLKERFNEIEKEMREIEEDNITKNNKYEIEMNYTYKKKYIYYIKYNTINQSFLHQKN
jgi:transcriptional regulator NrdR family protein